VTGLYSGFPVCRDRSAKAVSGRSMVSSAVVRKVWDRVCGPSDQRGQTQAAAKVKANATMGSATAAVYGEARQASRIR
jgi:hypothetical protein